MHTFIHNVYPFCGLWCTHSEQKLDGSMETSVWMKKSEKTLTQRQRTECPGARELPILIWWQIYDIRYTHAALVAAVI